MTRNVKDNSKDSELAPALRKALDCVNQIMNIRKLPGESPTDQKKRFMMLGEQARKSIKEADALATESLQDKDKTIATQRRIIAQQTTSESLQEKDEIIASLRARLKQHLEDRKKEVLDFLQLEALNQDKTPKLGAKRKFDRTWEEIRLAKKQKAGVVIDIDALRKKQNPRQESTEVQEALRMFPVEPRSGKPRGLTNVNSSCFANAAMQALATALDPNWVQKSLGDHLMIQNSRDKENPKFYPPVGALLDVLQRLRHPSSNSTNPGKFLQLLADDTSTGAGNGDIQESLDVLLENSINSLAYGAAFPRLRAAVGGVIPSHHGLLEALFRVDERAYTKCLNKRSCDHSHWSTDKLDWFLRLGGEGTGLWSVPALLDRKRAAYFDSEDYACDGCGEKGTTVRTFEGLYDLPEILIIAFDRWDSNAAEARFGSYGHGESSGKRRKISYERGTMVTNRFIDDVPKLRYGVKLDETLDLADWAFKGNHGDDIDHTRTEYQLRSVIFHRGDPGRGHYVAYTQSRDGTWWQCNDTVVTRCASHQDLYKDPGEASMAFYQRLPGRGVSKDVWTDTEEEVSSSGSSVSETFET